jgi:hypothetical protein
LAISIAPQLQTQQQTAEGSISTTWKTPHIFHTTPTPSIAVGPVLQTVIERDGLTLAPAPQTAEVQHFYAP